MYYELLVTIYIKDGLVRLETIFYYYYYIIL